MSGKKNEKASQFDLLFQEIEGFQGLIIENLEILGFYLKKLGFLGLYLGNLGFLVLYLKI